MIDYTSEAAQDNIAGESTAAEGSGSEKKRPRQNIIKDVDKSADRQECAQPQDSHNIIMELDLAQNTLVRFVRRVLNYPIRKN